MLRPRQDDPAHYSKCRRIALQEQHLLKASPISLTRVKAPQREHLDRCAAAAILQASESAPEE